MNKKEYKNDQKKKKDKEINSLIKRKKIDKKLFK